MTPSKFYNSSLCLIQVRINCTAAVHLQDAAFTGGVRSIFVKLAKGPPIVSFQWNRMHKMFVIPPLSLSLSSTRAPHFLTFGLHCTLASFLASFSQSLSHTLILFSLSLQLKWFQIRIGWHRFGRRLHLASIWALQTFHIPPSSRDQSQIFDRHAG